jgi:hypothetical protein
MKAIYFLRTLALVTLMGLVTNVTATDFTIPDGATDTDLAAILEQAATGDNIFIQGTVAFEAPVLITKNVHFIGKKGEFVGFDGQGMTKLFNFEPEVIEGESLTFENLWFVDAYCSGEGSGDGGVGNIAAGTLEFKGCSFDGNHAFRGGAFFIMDTANVHFENCEGTNNEAENRGGFSFSDGATPNVSFDYCHLEGNSTLTERGGACTIFGGSTYRFFYTVISGNRTGDAEGGTNEGGAFFTDGSPSVTFESCSITGNTAYGHGGMGFLLGTPNITFINTLIAGNESTVNCAPLTLGSGEYTFVNVTLVDNIGQNPGNGAGIIVWGETAKLNIFNSILVRNVCSNQEGAVDMKYNGAPHIENTLFKNSIVGLISGVDMSVAAGKIQDANTPNKSLINMYNIAGESSQVEYFALDQSGVNFQEGLQLTTPFGLGFYTLKDENAYAAKLGDPVLLDAQDVYTDQLLVERTTTNGAIYAGAVQSVTGYAPEVEDNVAIKTPAALAKEDIRVIGTVSNGILGVDFGELRGQAKGDLISINGQVVEHIFNTNVVGKGYYNVHVTPGFYILKVTIEGKTVAKRLIVK